MTKLEAVCRVVAQLTMFGNRLPSDDEDEECWEPRAQDLEILSALVDRPVTEADLCFFSSHCQYTAREELLSEISIQEA